MVIAMASYLPWVSAAAMLVLVVVFVVVDDAEWNLLDQPW